MSFCQKCGNEIAPDAGFCQKCGTAVGSSAPAPAPVTTPVQQGAQAAGMPSDALAWLIAIYPLPIVFLPSWASFVVLFLVLFDVDRLLKKNGYVDRERLLAKTGYTALSLRLWALFVPPVYLYKRAKLLGQKTVLHWIWLVALIVGIIAAAVVYS